jgi:hypothetical protein
MKVYQAGVVLKAPRHGMVLDRMNTINGGGKA